MTRHSTNRTRNRIYVVIAILVVGYVIYDRMIERYHNPMGKVGSVATSNEAVLRRIEEKEKIKVAPEWTLRNLTGELFESKSLDGDVSLITFWSSSCGVCRSELPMLKELQEKYKDRGFKVVAIALDDHEDEDLRAFVIGEQLNYIVLRGDTKVTKKFGEIDVVPQSFLIDRKGNVVKYFLGKISEKEVESLIESALSSESVKGEE